MLNITVQYQTILKFGISHEYFNTKIPNETFSIIPTENTRILCEKIGLVIPKNKQELALVFDKDRDDSMLYFLENMEEIKFSFYIYSENALFKNFTNFPLENQNFIYYFNNQNVQNEKSNIIHTNNSVSNDDLFELKQNTLKIKPKTEVSLQNINGKEVLRKKNENETPLDLYLDILEEGKYIVLNKNKKVGEFLYLKPRMNRNPIALLELIFGKEEKRKLQNVIKEGENMTPFEYHINFATRHTFWRYFIVPRYSNSSKYLVIETKDKTVKFTNPEETILPHTDMKAYMFETNRSLALQQKYSYNFQLIKTKDSKGKSVKQVLEKLPYPNIDILKPVSREADAKIFSDIIVYI